MNKINFQDLPNETTPINANNLNQLQTNIDNAKLEKTGGDITGNIDWDAATHSNADANDYLKTGSHLFSTGCTNVPQSWTRVLTLGHSSSSNTVQLGFGIQNGNVHYRIRNTNWNNWISLLPETITNSNGTAVKFPDGTMICWNYMTVNDQAINSPYGNMFIGNRDIDFPAQFISAPSGHCSMFKWGSGASWGTCASVTASKITVRGYDYQSRGTGTNCYISWSAIGRWK